MNELIVIYPGARRPTFIRSEKKMNTGVSAGTAITTLTVVGPKPDRTKADPGANAKTRAVYYSLRPRWAGGGVQDALRGHTSGHASGQRTHDIVQRTRVQHRARHGGHVLHAWASR